jgi:DNA invertase Pin-like site-specific DNA recombinase
VKRSKSEAVSLGRRSKPASRSAKKPAQPVGQWAPELQHEVLARYAAGESGVTIAAALGLGPCSVYKLLRERGVTRAIADTRRMRQPKPRPSEPTTKLKTKAVARSNESVALPPDVAERAVTRYAEGEPPGAIAAVLGVALGRVYRCLKERGAWRDRSEAAKVRHAREKARREREGPPVQAPKPEPRPLPAEMAESVVERYLAGDTGEAIAADLHIGHGRVYRLLRERGVLRTPAATLRLRVEAGAVRDDRRNGSRRLPAYVVVEVLERYVAGEGGTTIARALGLKKSQVYDLLEGHGVIRQRRRVTRPLSD